MLIYKITNKASGKAYVGLTKHIDLSKRIKTHISASKVGSDCPLHRAFRKYGVHAFSIEAIDNAESMKQLAYKEKFWIKFCDTQAPRGYNLTSGGENTEFTEELRIKLSIAASNRFAKVGAKEAHSKKVLAGITQEFRDLKASQAKQQFSNIEARDRVSKTSIEKWASEEYRAKTIAAQRNGWATESSKLNASIAAKNRHSSGVYTSRYTPVRLSDGREFPTITECAKAIGASQGNVSACLAGKRKSTKGFTISRI